MVREGDPAPDFQLESDSGETVRLSDFRGQPVVLYFYPKDDTPGCTKEACSFRDSYASFRDARVPVLGVSPDTTKSHTKFKTKYDLPFTLLADPDHQVAKAYGVWTEKQNYGRKYMGVARTTFLIDAEGRVKKVFEKVKPEGHAEEVLAAIV